MSFSSSRLSTCGIPKPFPVPFSKSPGDVGLKKPIPGFYPRPTESESLGVIWGICVFNKLSAKNKCLFLTRIGDFLTNISSADSCYSETSWLWSHGPAYDVQRVTISLGMPGPWGRGIPQNSVRLHSTWPFFFFGIFKLEYNSHHQWQMAWIAAPEASPNLIHITGWRSLTLPEGEENSRIGTWLLSL